MGAVLGEGYVIDWGYSIRDLDGESYGGQQIEINKRDEAN